jgi:hypothetical protein
VLVRPPGRAKLVVGGGDARTLATCCRLQPCRLDSTGLGLPLPYVAMYVSIVSDVSYVCCNCSILMLQK